MKNSTSTHWIIGLIIAVLAVLVGYLLFNNVLKKDKQSLVSKLDELFEGKSAVTDGQQIFITGELSKNKRHFSLFMGGFNVYELLKESEGFVKKEFNAGDLNFKEDEYKIDPEYGFRYETYRPNVQTCYDRSFDLLLKGNETQGIKASYSPNKYVDLKNFPQGYSTEFFSIENTIHPKEFYQGQTATGKVYTNSYEVSYSKDSRYYEIVENKEAKSKSLMTYLLSSLAIGLLLAFFAKPLAKSLQPNPETSNSMFDKKWKNINKNFIMSFETGMRGNNKAIVVEEGKIKKGTMKFTDNGKNMHISLADTEYYFQIDKLTDNVIEVLDLASEKTEQFEVLGSGALTK
jgi:hypothetical protein